MEKLQEVTDEVWKAIIENDAQYNHHFIYAVKTTGIFCRPSCKSRPPKRTNVRIFRNAEDALSENFRPCKRCKPLESLLPDEEWVAKIIQYIDSHFHESLSLAKLAKAGHGSPYHLQRTFKKVMGRTPIDYIQNVRINHAKILLSDTDDTVTTIAQATGIPNIPYFISLFKRKTGYTPIAYRQCNLKEEDS